MMNPNEPSTVFVVLFSADATTTQILDNFVKQFQKGLDDTVSRDPPAIHCLYRREGAGDAFQYKLTKGGSSLPGPTAFRYSGSMKEQLEGFFNSSDVRSASATKGHVYLIIGAHGSPSSAGLGISIIGQILKELFLALTLRKRQGSVLARMRALWQRWSRPSLPSGVAIQSGKAAENKGITITELNQALMQLCRTPDTMMLHSCNLSSVESLFEIQHIEHHIACETSLKGYMCASEWFSALESGLPPQQFTDAVFDRLRCQNQPGGRAEGVFSSHKSSGVIELIKLLNCLGRELTTILMAGNQENIGKVVIARSLSNAESWDQVDLSKFSELCADYLGGSFTQLSLDIKQTLGAIQYGRKITRSYNAMRGHGGISVVFPVRESGIDVEKLPSNFRTAADDWMSFLDDWVF